MSCLRGTVCKAFEAAEFEEEDAALDAGLEAGAEGVEVEDEVWSGGGDAGGLLVCDAVNGGLEHFEGGVEEVVRVAGCDGAVFGGDG